MFIVFDNSRFNAKFAGFFSIGGNFILYFIKIWAGIITGSVALVADAWHTLSDSVSSIILLIGIYASRKPADKDHPFGHGRAEVIASLVIGLILVLISLNFMYESINKIIEKKEVKFGIIAISATIISLVSKEIMAQISFAAARREKLKSLEADGWHHRSDAFTSAIILIGIFAGRYFWWIDGVLGIFVSVMILILAYRIVKDSINPLLGETPDAKLLEQVMELSRDIYTRDLHLHHFHLHRYGHHTELTFHIELPGNYRLEEANKITSQLTKRIKNEMNIFTTIYIDSYN